MDANLSRRGDSWLDANVFAQALLTHVRHAVVPPPRRVWSLVRLPLLCGCPSVLLRTDVDDDGAGAASDTVDDGARGV